MYVCMYICSCYARTKYYIRSTETYIHTYIYTYQCIYIHYHMSFKHEPAKLSNVSLTLDHKDTHLPDVWQSHRSLLLLLRMYGRSLYIYKQFLAQERHTLLYLASFEEHLRYIHTCIISWDLYFKKTLSRYITQCTHLYVHWHTHTI